MGMSRVSVCTSVLNQSAYLKRMIESVRAQTFADWDLFIVDDGSTEDIAAVVAEFNDPRSLVHRFDLNQGIPHGLNYAMAHSGGDYLQPLSADEWISPDKLAVQVEYLDSHADIGCVWGLPGKSDMGMGERPTWEQFALKAHNRTREAWIRTLVRLENIPIGGASMLMRRECYADIGGFDPALFGPSDLEWFVRFFEKYEGRVLPYRWADADQPDTRLTAPHEGQAERFSADMALVRDKHPIPFPLTTGKVSIGIPNFNMAGYVAHAIESALNQTYPDIEVLVLDDASTDESVKVIQNFSDNRIRFLQFDENRGTVAAINQMAAMATGEWYVSLAADDLLEPTTIERMVNEFVRDPWLEFVATQTDFIDKDGAPYAADHPFKAILKAGNKPREEWLRQLYYGNQYFGVGMYRRKVLLDLGGWNAEHGVLTDYEMYLRLLQRENIHVIEESLTHTRIHDGNKSLLNVEEGRKLRQRYYDARLPYYQPRMKVIIATPFYEMRGFSPYIASLVQTIQILTRNGIEHEFWELSGDSYVDRAKNTLFNKFLEDPCATDIFMIDSDMQWEPNGFIQMLMQPEEIVQGSYPQKNMWETYTARPHLEPDAETAGVFHPVGRVLSDGSALLKAQYLAGGFLRIKRAALQKYKDHYTEYVYHDMGADPSYPDRKYTEFFTCERKVGPDGMSLRWGEDRVFGLRMQEIGIESWIYPNIAFGHYGIKGWQGNFHTHLTSQQKPPEAA
jgi:glycosyltransferase involved in cell wall biosynthesis